MRTIYRTVQMIRNRKMHRNNVCQMAGLSLALAFLAAAGAAAPVPAEQILAGLGAPQTEAEKPETAAESETEYMPSETGTLLTENGTVKETGTTGTVSETDTESAMESVTESTTESAEKAGSGRKASLGPLKEIQERYLKEREARGEKWAVSILDFNTDELYEYNADERMQSASVIKVFIMGAVYDRICCPEDEASAIIYEESYEGELRSLLEDMIRVSDNQAANRLVEILGSGDFEKGKLIVDEFCRAHGFDQTHMGRRFLAENPTDDNYTSAGDCCAILEEIYRGTLVNEEASGKMYGILQGQTLQYKIPSVLPEGYFCANKTGEMPEGYGLGCIENDVAIVTSPTGNYILAVLSNELGGRNEEAQQVIQHISADTAVALLPEDAAEKADKADKTDKAGDKPEKEESETAAG